MQTHGSLKSGLNLPPMPLPIPKPQTIGQSVTWAPNPKSSWILGPQAARICNPQPVGTLNTYTRAQNAALGPSRPGAYDHLALS